MPGTAIAQEPFLLALERRAIIYESFGVFWIVAECLILAGVLLARRHLQETPTLATVRWDSRALWLILSLGAIPLVLGALLLLRHMVLPGAAAMWASGHEEIDAIIGVMLARQREHLLVWSIMVVIWVVLESCIVYHGWRAYYRLDKLLPRPASGTGPRDKPSLAVLSLLLALGLLGAIPVYAAAPTALAGSGEDPLLAAYLGDEPIRSAAYLVIRLAAVAWIIVEWIAAIYLWRGYRRLRYVVEQNP